MCGIAGYSLLDTNLIDQFNPQILKDSILHRGPDDSGIYLKKEEGIGLIHTRLSILDLTSSGHQPMVSEDGNIVLIYNGEIYNYRELKENLLKSGHSFKGNSDTEVLLKMYMEHRSSDIALTEMLKKLNGIFAFAIWNQDEKALFLARDALGVKPLYYYNDDTQFLFASEIKTIHSQIPDLGEIDSDSIHRYLTFLWCPGTGTPVQSVKKVNPGEALWVRSGKITKRKQWYSLPAFRPVEKIKHKKDAINETEEHLRKAVHSQMVADVPVGAFLSGGLDSSSVVAFAKELNPNIHCFTIETAGGTDSGITDDLPFAREVATHLKVPLEIVSIDSSKMADDLELMIKTLDEPLSDPAPLNVLYISRLARESGMKVLLSGAGGDDLFTGYRRHHAIQLEKYWGWMPNSVRSALEKSTGSLDSRKPLQRKIQKLFNGAGLSDDERLLNYFKWINRDDLINLYSKSFKDSILDKDATKSMSEFIDELPSGLSKLEQMLVLEQRFFLTDHNLNYTDKMSMMAGIETRVPFLDIDLVEFSNRIPIRYKQKGKIGKWILKKAMEPYLPKNIIYRTKSGFGAPLRRWVRCELKELIGDILSESSLKKRGIFNPIEVQKLIAFNNSGKLDASYTIFSLLCIEIWCRNFLKENGKKTNVK